MNIKRAIIFLNGDLVEPGPLKAYIDSKKTMLIACDGGLRQLEKLGYKPGIIIGDFDSIGALSLPAGIPQIRYPANKDKTDSALAIRYAMEAGFNEIILTGFIGNRVDHMLGNIFLLTQPDFNGIKLKIIDGFQEIYVVRSHATIRGSAGDTMSFFPIGGETIVSSTGGLKYALDNYVLSATGNQSISNVLTKNQTKIEVTQGMVLVVHHKAP